MSWLQSDSWNNLSTTAKDWPNAAMCSDESRMVIYHCSVAGNLKSTSNIKLEDARDTTSHLLNATYQEQVPSRTNVC